MGGYAPFVWPSYLLSALVIVFNIMAARRSLRLAQQAARRRFDLAADRSAS
jgi:heme exporter protein CcmD